MKTFYKWLYSTMPYPVPDLTMGTLGATIALIVMLVFSGTVEAEPLKLRFVTLDKSVHYDTSKTYNQNHGGMGFEVKLGEYWYGALHYSNSYDEPTNVYTVAHEKSNGWGIITGVAYGYSKAELMPVAGVSRTWKYFRVVITPAVTYTQLIVPLH